MFINTFLKLKAFTLVEVLLSLSLLAMVFFFTIPMYSAFHEKNQIQVIAEDINAAIRYAKTYAMTQEKNVILMPIDHSKDWSMGMQLSIYNSAHQYQLIHEWDWHSPNVQVDWHGFQSKHYLLFSADPRQNDVNGAFTITGSARGLKLVINKLGRIRVC